MGVYNRTIPVSKMVMPKKKKTPKPWIIAAIVLGCLCIVAIIVSTIVINVKEKKEEEIRASESFTYIDVGEGENFFFLNVTDFADKTKTYCVHTNQTVFSDAMNENRLIKYVDTAETELIPEVICGLELEDGYEWVFSDKNGDITIPLTELEILYGETYEFSQKLPK